MHSPCRPERSWCCCCLSAGSLLLPVFDASARLFFLGASSVFLHFSERESQQECKGKWAQTSFVSVWWGIARPRVYWLPTATWCVTEQGYRNHLGKHPDVFSNRRWVYTSEFNLVAASRLKSLFRTRATNIVFLNFSSFFCIRIFMRSWPRILNSSSRCHNDIKGVSELRIKVYRGTTNRFKNKLFPFVLQTNKVLRNRFQGLLFDHLRQKALDFWKT